MTKELTVEEAIKRAKKWVETKNRYIPVDVLEVLLAELDRLKARNFELEEQRAISESTAEIWDKQLTLADRLADRVEKLCGTDDPILAFTSGYLSLDLKAYKESRK